MCVPTPAKDINSTTCVHIDSMCIGCSMSVPLRAIALQPFYPNMNQPKVRETRSWVSANELMLTESILCTWQFSINYCTTTAVGIDSNIYMFFCDKNLKLLKGIRKNLKRIWCFHLLVKYCLSRKHTEQFFGMIQVKW